MNSEHHMARMSDDQPRGFGVRSDVRKRLESSANVTTILDVVWKHRAYGFSPGQTLCACDRTWRNHDDQIVHLANAIRAHVASGGVL